ncbi:unnamed protein product [Closterium sp. NIES-53]
MTSATLAAPSAASARLAGPSAAGCGQPATCSLIASSAGVSRRASAALTSDFLPSRPVNRQALRAATGRKPRATSVRPGHVFASADVAQLRGAREAIKDIITSKSCNPILIRLGWHDAGTFDKSVGEWPKQGGANGSIRFRPEIDHGANKGLAGAIALLQPVKDAFPAVSWADLFQLASATAVELAFFPSLPPPPPPPLPPPSTPPQLPHRLPFPDPLPVLLTVRCGSPLPSGASAQGVLPHGAQRPGKAGRGPAVSAPTDAPCFASCAIACSCHHATSCVSSHTPMSHQDVKAKQDEDLLVLPPLMAHPPHCLIMLSTFSSHPHHLLISSPPPSHLIPTTFSSHPHHLLISSPPPSHLIPTTLSPDAHQDVKAKQDEDLLVLPTDAVLFEDPGFKVYAEKYAADQAAFFKEYAAAHKALSELGAKFDPPQGVALDTEGPRPVKFVAAEYSSGNTQSEMSSAMKKKLRDEYIGLGGSPDRPLQTNYFLYIMIGVAVLAILTKLTGAI